MAQKLAKDTVGAMEAKAKEYDLGTQQKAKG